MLKKMTWRKSTQNSLNTASVYCTICCCFFIPLSSALMGAFAVAAFVFWIFSGKVSTIPLILKKSVPSLFAFSLFFLLTAGLFYSPEPLSDAASTLKKYRELLFFVMTVSLFHNAPRKAERAESAFIAGSIVLLSLSYAMFFSIIPTEKFGYSTVHHITHSFFMAVLAFWCLQRGISSQKYKYFWFLVVLLSAINLFYIAPGRTGMLVFIALVLITFLQRLSLKKSILAIMAACLLITGFFLTSNNFASRIKLAVHEIEHYQNDDRKNRSSLGMRFDWWKNSVELIRQKPVFGHGTGSFEWRQITISRGTKVKTTDNPHNEYLLLGVQVGLVGTTLFICLLGSLFINSCKLKTTKRYLLQGVVMAMGAGCLMNSFLFDSHQGHFFAIISALLYAGSGTITGIEKK